MSFPDYLRLVIGNTAFLGVVLLVARQFETKFPIETAQSADKVILDWKLAVLKYSIGQALAPIVSVCGLLVINAVGGGWIHLRSDGWWFLLSLIVLILAIDFWSYLVHRAFHKFPALWAMHSLHHSAETLTAVTGARHFWLEEPLITALPVVGIIFKVPPEMVTPIVLIALLPDGLAHMNVRLSLGRFALVLNNPQYHRIHHSREPRHFDKNFCKILPLFDVIFGTAWKPGKDEFPTTGLAGEKVTGLVNGFVWPVRHWIRRGTAAATIAADRV